MRDFPLAVTNHLNSTSGISMRMLVWISAKNRITNQTETLGLWNGDDHQDFTIDSQVRTYYGAGNFISADPLMTQVGLNIRKFNLRVSPITPEMNQVLRGYNPKMAPVQIHSVCYNTDNDNIVGQPFEVFRGWIDKFPIRTPSIGGEGEGSIEMVGYTRILTNRLAIKRSDENQRRRLSTDTFFNDVAITGQVITPWGSKQ